VNLPESATPEDIAATYRAAWDSGCRGITVFRTGSKGGQSVLRAGDTPAVTAAVPEETPGALWKTNQRVLTDYAEAARYRVQTAMGTAHVHISTDDDGPLEVYARVGKVGSEVAALTDALGRLMSLILQMPSSAEPMDRLRAIIEQLQGIGGQSIGIGPSRTLSLPDAVAKALARHYNTAQVDAYAPSYTTLPDGSEIIDFDYAPVESDGTIPGPGVDARLAHATQLAREIMGDLCPECGRGTLIRAEGCEQCTNCFYSKC
jgi:ribonucleoside-diphosphate reductase alpha chain